MNLKEPNRRREPIDDLLSDFFRGELPASFPAFRRPAPRRALPLPAWLTPRRLALAASVAVLALAAWMLPHAVSVPPRDGVRPIGPADAHKGILVAPEAAPDKKDGDKQPDLDLLEAMGR